MKFEKNSKYNTNALLVLIVVAFAAFLVSIVVNFDAFNGFWAKMFSVLSPILYSFLIVLVLSPIMDYFERLFSKLFKNQKIFLKRARAFAVICTYVILVLAVTLVVLILVSQASKGYLFIAKFADEYFPVLTKFVTEISARFEFLAPHLNTIANSINSAVSSWLANVPDLAVSLAGALGNVISLASGWLLAIIISIYALFRREKLKAIFRKTNVAIFSEKSASQMSAFFGDLYKNLGAFLSSRTYNMVALAVVYYLVLLIMGLEFYSLIALIVAVCSFVPIVGTLIGGAIGAFIVLVTEPSVLWRFAVVFIVLTFMDYLYLRPVITSKRVQVSLGTTLICVFLGYFLADLLGALLALPLYITVRDFLLRNKELFKNEKETVKNSAE